MKIADERRTPRKDGCPNVPNTLGGFSAFICGNVAPGKVESAPMSKLETPMIMWFWESVGGTLILEFQAVPRASDVGRRRLDAIILPACRSGKRIGEM